MIEIEPIITAAIGSAAVAFYWYLNQTADPTKPTERFLPEKIAPTIIVGIIIGIMSVVAGWEPLTEANVATQMITYGLLTSAVETGLKTIYRWTSNLNIQTG